MRILVFHGYLLRGTGSNVYNARLAAALARQGNEVDLLSQERRPQELGFVDAVGTWRDGEPHVETLREPVRVNAWRPEIGEILPVYVPDRYEGVTARPYEALSDEEIERYVEANVRAVRDVIARARPVAALANHLIMGPLILARALAGSGIPYVVKVHGSALEYTVKRHPERFLAPAREGLAGARAVLVGSRHTAESLWAALDVDGLAERTRPGPPGVDVEAFRVRPREEAAADLRELAQRLAAMAPGAGESAFARDPGEAARALAAIDPGHDRLVAFTGKLIHEKGIALLLDAWPRVVAAEPRARLVVAGFGPLRAELEARGTERVLFTGRLEHDELAPLLALCEAQVVPSVFPEAFGMVAAEAAACGALPIVADHSGLAEVAAVLAAAVPPQARELLTFPLGADPAAALAQRIIAWLRAPEPLRAQTRQAIAATARERWSWDGVADGLLAAAGVRPSR